MVRPLLLFLFPSICRKRSGVQGLTFRVGDGGKIQDTPKEHMIRNGASKKSRPSLSERISLFLSEKLPPLNPSDVPHRSQFSIALVRIFSIVILKVMKDAVTFRARGLTLTVVLAMAPMLALGTAILKDVGITEETQHFVHEFFDKIVVLSNAVEKNPADSGKGGYPGIDLALDSGTPKEVAGQNLVIHVQQVVDKIFDYVNKTDFATLGFAGTVAILILVASFFAHLEASMNAIWEVKKGRSPWKRGVNYLAVLILLPIAMNLGFAAMAVLQSPTLMEKLEAFLPSPWMVSFLLKMFPALVVTGTFAALYKSLPNTRVSTWFSISGGLLAGIGWLLVLSLYINLQLGVARYNAIYGSFATLPLVLLWIYMGWVIFLMGAELVFAFQVWREYEPRDGMLPIDSQLAIVIDVFMVLKREENLGHFVDAGILAKILGRPTALVAEALDHLERAGFIRKGKDGDSAIIATSRMERFDVHEVERASA
jgi:membrane protein